MTHPAILTTILVLLVVPAAKAQSTPDPSVILRRIDSVANAPADMTSRAEMILVDSDGRQRTRAVRMRQKGTELRLVQFLSPADVRGVGFLRLASDRLYLYLPAFRRVRRIASSGLREDFVGTDFTYEDLSQNRYASDYVARSAKMVGGSYVLELVPRPGADVGYERLVLSADASNYVTRKIEYYDRGGAIEKVLEISDVAQIDKYWIGKRMEMTNRNTGHRTLLMLSDITFDDDLDDGLFSERSLKRPVR